MPRKKKNKGSVKQDPVEPRVYVIVLDGHRIEDGVESILDSSEALTKDSVKALVKVMKGTGATISGLHAGIKRTRKGSLKRFIEITDSSGEVIGEVAEELVESTGDLAKISRKGALLVIDQSGKTVGVISEETLKASGIVVKTTKDGAVLVRKSAEHVSGADEAKTKREYYERLGYFFIPLLALVMLYCGFFIFLPSDDALKITLGQLGYLVAIPGFDPNTLILGAKAAGVNPYLMALCIGIQDTIVGTFLCLNFDYVKRIPILGRFFADFEETGKELLAKYKWLNRFSVVGLFIFIVLPFQGCGPVGGSVVGRMIGIRKLYIIISIVVGSFLAVFALAYLADIISKFLPFWLQIAIPITIAALVITGFVYAHLKKRKERAQAKGKK